jgi:Tfp pilus assembly protein PilX
MIVNTGRARARNGFVLAAALLALLLIAALVAGVFFASTEATRMGAAAADRQLALTAGESEIERTIAAWNAVDARAAVIGGTVASSGGASGIPVAVFVTRIDSAVYWIVADAGPPHPGTVMRSRIGAFVRVRTTADGSTTVDRIPERWWSELF